MKKILIVNNNMHIGGVQKSLVNLLRSVSDRYEITLLLFYKGGALLSEIPENVRVLETASPFRYLGMTKNDVKRHPLRMLWRSVFAIAVRILGMSVVTDIMSIFQKKISEYDTVISFLHSGGSKIFYGGCNEFVLKNTVSSEKITFLHCDYSAVGKNSPENHGIYDSFDKIAACSDGCRGSFVSAEPRFAEKTFVVPNCHDFADIVKKAKEGEKLPTDERIKIVTVARLGKEKGVTRAVQAVSELGELKNRMHYYIVGDGIEGALIRDMISDLDLKETVTMCGEKSDPYGYIASADMLLIPSISEAAPMVIAEAACLGTPILSTETSSARDMVEATGFGLVCENSTEGLIQGLKRLISNPKEIEKLKNNLATKSFDNDESVAAFAALVG